METTKRLKLRPITNSPSPEGVYHLRHNDQGHRIGQIYERKHAVQIVTAVNLYEEMIDLLRFIRLDAPIQRNLGKDHVGLNEMIDAVLAKVKGE